MVELLISAAPNLVVFDVSCCPYVTTPHIVHPRQVIYANHTIQHAIAIIQHIHSHQHNILSYHLI